MIKYYTSSAYRKHYSDLQKLHLLDDSLDIEPYNLSTHILQRTKQVAQKSSKSPSKSMSKSKIQHDPQQYFIDLIDDLEVYKNITLSPIKIFKSLMLIHCCFLVVKQQPNEQNTDKLNNFFKQILIEADKLVEKCSTKESKKRNSFFGRSSSMDASRNSCVDKSGEKRNEVVKQFKSTRELSPTKDSNTSRPKSPSGKNFSDTIITKELCLLSNIIKPYILYLQKTLSIYSHYQSLLHSIPNTTQSSQESTWTILNLLKLQAPIIKTFSYIGRYFYKEYSPIVYFLIEFFSKEVYRMYPKIYSQAQRKIQAVSHEWFVLLEKHSEYEILYDDGIRVEGVEGAMLLIDQISKVNDFLFHIYYGKYFYQYVQRMRLPEPKWFEVSSKDCEFLIHYNEVKLRRGRRKSRQASRQKGTSQVLPQPKILQPIPSQPTPNTANLFKSTPANHHPQQIIIIQKKNATTIPKVKNSLKLGSQKENKQKDDTITFRMKNARDLKDVSRIMGDVSFGWQGEGESEVQTVRERVSRTSVAE